MSRKKSEMNLTVVGDIDDFWHNICIVRQKMFEIEFSKFSLAQQQYISSKMLKRGILKLETEAPVPHNP